MLHFIKTFDEARDNTDKQNKNETDMPKEAANECQEVITLGTPTDKDRDESEENEQSNDIITAETIRHNKKDGAVSILETIFCEFWSVATTVKDF